MLKHGLAAKPVWVTEFGWATQNTSQYYEYGNQMSFEQQADYLVRAVQYTHTHYAGWLTGMFVWNLNFASRGPARAIHCMSRRRLGSSMAIGAHDLRILPSRTCPNSADPA